MTELGPSAQLISESLGPLEVRGWLAGESAEFRAWVAANGRFRKVDAGQVLYLAGDPADGLWGLAEGALDITFPLVGEEPVTVLRAEAGFWIGDSAVLAGVPRLVYVAAATPSRVFFLPSQPVAALLRRQPDYWPAFYRLSHANFVTALSQLAETMALSPRARVARHLLRLADANGEVAASQADLARMIGVTRSTVQRSLGELTERGTVRSGYRSLIICNRAALDAVARDV